jgi:hypothetical protein
MSLFFRMVRAGEYDHAALVVPIEKNGYDVYSMVEGDAVRVVGERAIWTSGPTHLVWSQVSSGIRAVRRPGTPGIHSSNERVGYCEFISHTGSA